MRKFYALMAAMRACDAQTKQFGHIADTDSVSCEPNSSNVGNPYEVVIGSNFDFLAEAHYSRCLFIDYFIALKPRHSCTTAGVALNLAES